MVDRGRHIVAGALVVSALGLCAATGVASTTPPAPACAPATPDGSAQLDGAVTVSPMPGATDAPPQTQISFLGVPAQDLTAISVTGSESGVHTGRLLAYSQGDGGSFVLAKALTPGEHVTVSARLTLASGAQPLQFAFTVAEPDELPGAPARGHRLAAGAAQRFHSRPDLEPPIVTVHRRSSSEAPGDTFLAPYGVPAQAGPMILDRNGGLVWFDPLRRPTVATNVRVQTLGGAPVLTWWQGTVTTRGFGVGVDEIVGGDYQTIAVVRAGNGLESDLHEFQITPSGTALISAYFPVRCDLQALGGVADSAVTDSLLQEIDIKTGLVMFQWSPLDHVPLSASYSLASGASTWWPYDFFHLNSINLDPDGSLLVSSRNTWAAYDINSATGQLEWTLGGKDPTFVEEPGATTVYQHDARALGNDTYSLFDNGASPRQHLQSRGVVLTVDPQTGTVSRLAQFLHPGQPLLADSQGNLQALPDGHWFIGWGQAPDMSEFSAQGALVFDASLPTGYESYRALRFPWTGTPRTKPALAVAATHGGATAYASWNGATAVARWELLEGSSPQALARVGSVARVGFETAIPLRSEPADRFAAVGALDAQGATLATSAVVALPTRG
jgi:hypothetical protein